MLYAKNVQTPMARIVSMSGGVGSAVGMAGGSVGGAGSFIACIASISATFFYII